MQMGGFFGTSLGDFPRTSSVVGGGAQHRDLLLLLLLLFLLLLQLSCFAYIYPRQGGKFSRTVPTLKYRKTLHRKYVRLAEPTEVTCVPGQGRDGRARG